jgi:hypothetical protein
VWINNDQVPKLVKGDGYTQTSSPQPGDVGIYTTNGRLGTTQHSVTVTALDPNSGSVTTVTSKGGITPKVQTVPGPGKGSAWTDPKAKLQYYHKNKPQDSPPNK